MADIFDTPLAVSIRAGCNKLDAGCLPDEAERRLVARAAREFISSPSREREALLLKEAMAERDKWIRKLHADFGYTPRTIDYLAMKYKAGPWLEDEESIACPRHLAGTPELCLWHALKAHPDFPRDRQIGNVLNKNK